MNHFIGHNQLHFVNGNNNFQSFKHSLDCLPFSIRSMNYENCSFLNKTPYQFHLRDSLIYDYL